MRRKLISSTDEKPAKKPRIETENLNLNNNITEVLATWVKNGMLQNFVYNNVLKNVTKKFGTFDPLVSLSNYKTQTSRVCDNNPKIYAHNELVTLLNEVAVNDPTSRGQSLYKIIRFLVKTNGEIVFAKEGYPSGDTPCHYQMANLDHRLAYCITAGNAFFDNNDTLCVLDNKSGDFRPSFDSLQLALKAVIKSNIKLSDNFKVCQLAEGGGYVSSSSYNDTPVGIQEYRHKQSLNSSLALTCRLFHGALQKRRIEEKLMKYMVAGKLEMADKLLEMQPDSSSLINSSFKAALFKLVGLGEQSKVQNILKRHPEFLFEYGVITDISGAQPVIDGKNGLTVFQHGLWAGDVRFMCNMMLDCAPNNEFGEKIRVELFRQLNELIQKGVVYKLGSKEYKEKQFDLQPLISAIRHWQRQGQIVENWRARRIKLEIGTIETLRNDLLVVGRLQRYLPAIVRHQFCNNNFDAKKLDDQKELVRSLQFLGPRPGAKERLWSDAVSDGAVEFVMVNDWMAEGLSPEQLIRQPNSAAFKSNLEALTTLSKVRDDIDMPALVQRLQTPIQSLENQHAASPLR